ncbi:MAG: FAD:protein FMN transferase [Chloroflexi bacterium]|nr:FAD:protein FMN transferase [Chloroflexota bacterium]
MSIRAQAEIMGMPITIQIVDAAAGQEDVEAVFTYLRHVDQLFSTYKRDSETERINRGELCEKDYSKEMRAVIALCQETRKETGGYFDAWYGNRFDPSGLVKGYAIQSSAELLRRHKYQDFFVEAGGDIQTSGRNTRGEKWRVGIRNPFNPSELFAVVHLSGEGIATSGNYERGEHIYDPVRRQPANQLASLSVIASNVCDADRFATAAFAMGEGGLGFIEKTPGLECSVIAKDRRAHCTTGFQRFLLR